jgi:Uma2 family endonuclease
MPGLRGSSKVAEMIVRGLWARVPWSIVVVGSEAPSRRHEWPALGSLLLAVEVLSPTTARADRSRKRKLYQREGVAGYRMVDWTLRSSSAVVRPTSARKS